MGYNLFVTNLRRNGGWLGLKFFFRTKEIRSCCLFMTSSFTFDNTTTLPSFYVFFMLHYYVEERNVATSSLSLFLLSSLFLRCFVSTH